jgi:hypothetical protein
VVVLDVMLGQCNMIEHPLQPQDDILGLCVVDHSVVVYNKHYWRRFNLKVIEQ